MTSNLDTTDPVDRLALSMIRESHDLANTILNTITNLYRTFTTACRYPAKDAWLLTGRMTRILFDHMKAIRAGAKRTENILDIKVKAMVIWTLMESLAETRHILKIGIQSHPVTMKEIVEFGLEHRVDSSQLQTVRDEVDAMKKLTKEMAATVATQGDSPTRYSVSN